MRHFLFMLSLLWASNLFADSVYHSTDQYGRSEFSDRPPVSDFRSQEIIIENDYPWRIPKVKSNKKSSTKKQTRKSKKGSRKTKPEKKLSFLALREKCQRARSRYQNYRGTNNNEDWSVYKAKVAKYAEKRDYWCSRYLKRK